MKKRLRVLSLFFIALIGCGQQDDVLIVGTNAEFPPFEYIGGPNNDEIIGLDIDIAKQIAADAGKKLRIENMTFASLITALEVGEIDLIAAGMTINEVRAKMIDFSIPYYDATLVVISNKNDDSLKSIQDLKNKKIAVRDFSQGEILAKRFSDRVSVFESGTEALMELKNTKVELVLFESTPAKKFLEKEPSLQLQDMGFEPDFYGFAVAKGDSRLLDQVNKTLIKMKENGHLDKLFNQYMK